VKSGTKAGNAGMNIFAKKFNPDKVLLVGTGGIPFYEFLKINPAELYWKTGLRLRGIIKKTLRKYLRVFAVWTEDELFALTDCLLVDYPLFLM
jgi:hypothetical protein